MVLMDSPLCITPRCIVCGIVLSTFVDFVIIFPPPLSLPPSIYTHMVSLYIHGCVLFACICVPTLFILHGLVYPKCAFIESSVCT